MARFCEAGIQAAIESIGEAVDLSALIYSGARGPSTKARKPHGHEAEQTPCSPDSGLGERLSAERPESVGAALVVAHMDARSSPAGSGRIRC